jgi:putative ABC transport system permease protein
MNGLYHDAHYALRLLRRQPAFSFFVILTLAVGIGANSAVFSVVNGVLLRPLPYYDPDRLVAVWGRFDPESGFDFPEFPLSNPEYIDYREHSRALSAIAAHRTSSVTVTTAGTEPEKVPIALVTANLFGVLGASPVLGRTFSSDEDRPNGPAVVVLSHGYWQSRFGGDSRVSGSTIRVNGEPVTVVGVMPQGFAYPLNTTRMWMPLRIDPANPGNRKAHSIRAIGRLAGGSDLTSARAELQALMNSWKARLPDVHTGHYLFIRPLLEDVAGSVKPALALLLASTGFVLLIACANIAMAAKFFPGEDPLGRRIRIKGVTTQGRLDDDCRRVRQREDRVARQAGPSGLSLSTGANAEVRRGCVPDNVRHRPRRAT